MYRANALLPVIPLRVHPPDVFQHLLHLGTTPNAERIAHAIIDVSKEWFCLHNRWDYHQLYLILMLAHYSTSLRTMLIDENTASRWHAYLQCDHLDKTVEKHLNFTLSPLDFVQTCLDFLFIL